MTNFTELTKLMIERKELNNQYGSFSSHLYPARYARMEDIEKEVFEELAKVEPSEVIQRHMYDSLDSIAIDFMNSNYNEESLEYITYYTQDEFIERYIVKGIEGEAERMIDSLMNWMDSDTLGRWIDRNYLTNMPNTYTNRWVSYILMVNE
ncbi:hypothetical protein [Bacillus altitudinis]|uniref:hypothetical protein n=1 Tax=Bacillus altitudinis TaxID=293387 RepID=UPI0021013D94|nr:hypothetical protein [Bacillus altitudinis]UTV34852.1 hypothetical protein NM966_19860 [Bacillus altitudinis]